MWIKQTIGEQRKVLTALFEPTMANLAKQCTQVWPQVEGLDKLLSEQFGSIPHSHLVYAIDKFGKQVSANVTRQGIDSSFRGQDLSRRPYSVSLYPKRHFMLSSVYISNNTGNPCISAVQPIIDEQHQFLGFLVADFDIRDLPLSIEQNVTSSPVWETMNKKNPPQPIARRQYSQFDQRLDEVLSTLHRLMKEHGVFHCTLHYSSGQAMLWHINEPYQYRLYSTDLLLTPEIFVTYERIGDIEKAVLSSKEIRQVLERFRTLRLADNSIYLRSGSLNIINGMVGLSFSCEGSQYMSAESFLNKNLSFWFGQTAINA